MSRFNLIGFNFNKGNIEYKHCIVHPGCRLVQSTQEPDLLYCPLCGTNYVEKDTATDERIQSMFGPTSQQSKIVQAKKQKKYFDQSGNEINDEQLQKDMAQGAHVISYQEFKMGEDKPIIKKR